MSLHFAVAAAAVMCLAMAAASLSWPDRVFRRSAVAAICAAILHPMLVLQYCAGPFLGDGAGLGIALILHALSAAILLAAISASLGAAARRVWGAMQE